MQEIRSFCDEAYSLIRAHGEKHFNIFSQEVVPASKFFPQNPQTQKAEIAKPFEGDIVLANKIGERCYHLRNECLRNIGDKILFYPQARIKYAKRILEEMYDMQLNHPIHDYRKFFDLIIPEVFVPIIWLFIENNVNIYQVLISCRKTHQDYFCYWLDKYISKETDEQEQPSLESLKKLFASRYQQFVPLFIKRLEQEHIIKDGIYCHKKKNYLARLVTYMLDKDFICSKKGLPTWRHFYEYFGVKVVGSMNGDIENEEKMTTTESNLCKSLTKELSDEEEKEFALICSVFLPKL